MEPLLVEELLQRLTAALLPDPAAGAWNREVLDADTASPDAIVTAGWALPLFAGRRLVLVRGLGEASAKTVERLRAAVERARSAPGGWPAEGTSVVFVAAGVERRAPALRLLAEPDHVEVRAPVGRAVAGWVRERARTSGLDLAPEAAQALIDLVGEDLGRLAAELEKAALYARADRRVSEDIVRALSGETRARQYWELTQALEGANRVEALWVLDRLLAGGDEPLVVLAWLVGYVHDLWRVCPGGPAGPGGPGGAAPGDARQAARLLPRRRPDWAVERLMARASAVGIDRITSAVGRCFEVERQLKSSGGDPRALLTMLVADLAR